MLKPRSGKCILFTAFEERLNKLLNNFFNYPYLKPADGYSKAFRFHLERRGGGEASLPKFNSRKPKNLRDK